MTRADLSRLCGISRAAVTKFCDSRKLIADRNGEINPDHIVNRAYIESKMMQIMTDVMIGHDPPPFWFALYVQRGGRSLPWCAYPPAPWPNVLAFDDWDQYRLDEETGEAVETATGTRYAITVRTNKESPSDFTPNDAEMIE